MMSHRPETDPALARYRGYLHVLARLRLGRRLRGRLDPSDLVQQTLLKAHQATGRCQARDDAGREAWLRRILNNTIADELRRHGRGHAPVADARHAPRGRTTARPAAEGPSPDRWGPYAYSTALRQPAWS